MQNAVSQDAGRAAYRLGGENVHCLVVYFLFVRSIAGAAEITTEAPHSPSELTSKSQLDAFPFHPPRFFAKMTYLTSRAPGKDFRSFQQQNGDDAGNMTENSTLPNLNYLSLHAMYAPTDRHHFMVGGTQSLDPPSQRMIKGPGGRGFPLPGTLAALMYSFDLNRNLSFQLGEVYVDAFGFTDPIAGLGYRADLPSMMLATAGLSLSAPISPMSRRDHLVTQAMIRTGLAKKFDFVTISGHVTYARPFYQSGADVPLTMAPDGTLAKDSPPSPSSPPSAPSPPPGGLPPGPSNKLGGSPPPPSNLPQDPTIETLEVADIVMRERVIDRTNAGFAAAIKPGKWKVGSGAGVTYIQTARQNAIWLTSARILAVSYGFKSMEVGADAGLFSDISRYQHPSLPKLWNIGMHVSYLFGPDPRQGI